MKTQRPEIKYSDPVRELMGEPPRIILRWGTLIVFFIFMLFFLIAWLIKYPDFVPSPIEITTENPPVTMVSRTSGRIIHLPVKERDTVHSGDILAVIETAADLEEITRLTFFCDTVINPSTISYKLIPDLTKLGEIQVFFSQFRKNLLDLNNFILNDYYGNRIKSTKAEIQGIRAYVAGLEGKEKIFLENLRLEENSLKRNAQLFDSAAVSKSEFENAQRSFNNRKLELQDIRVDIAAKKLDLINREQLINELTVTRKEEFDKLISQTDESLRILKGELAVWKTKHIITSSIEGVITLTRIWKVNQTVSENEQVLTVIPLNQGKYIGRVNLKMQRSGKVDTGQVVNIKLAGFPYLEYGMIEGKVKLKSLASSGESYVIEIALPNGLRTKYGYDLPFSQNMLGTAEFITNDRTLLEKLASPFRHVVSLSRR